MKFLHDLLKKFNSSLFLDESLVIRKKGRLFLLDTDLKRFLTGDFFHAGLILGKVKGNIFSPSFPFLSIINNDEKANKVVVDGQSEWLFVCGRDLFRRGIIGASGAQRKGDFTLVLNRHYECLGFGEVIATDGDKHIEQKVAVKHILDVGDFLRRERSTRR